MEFLLKNSLCYSHFALPTDFFTACTCNKLGTINNEGCDQVSGECTCKRYVIGRDCNQCQQEYYGLSDDISDGCKPCDCDPGGAYNNMCDVINGQCRLVSLSLIVELEHLESA